MTTTLYRPVNKKEFEVRSDYLKKFEIQNVGGEIHNELWIPAEELDEFNDNIVGRIEVVESYEKEDPAINKS